MQQNVCFLLGSKVLWSCDVGPGFGARDTVDFLFAQDDLGPRSCQGRIDQGIAKVLLIPWCSSHRFSPKSEEKDQESA